MNECICRCTGFVIGGLESLWVFGFEKPVCAILSWGQ